MLCIGRECRTCPNRGAVSAFPSHTYDMVILSTVFGIAAIRVYRNLLSL